MKLGIGISMFPWAGEEIGPVVSRIATAADEAGADSLWVMDHFFQIRLTGLPPESPMPEAYATLAFLGGLTRQIKLGTLVTSVAYRHPGVLVKAVTTLDVMTGGRAVFGVGAGASESARRSAASASGDRCRRRAAPMAARSYMSAVCSTHQPPLTSPRRWPSGTRASLRKTSLNRASPVAWRSGRTSTPACRMARKKNVKPRCLGASQSVRAMSSP